MQKNLYVWYPFPKSFISQTFGENANALYAGQGLKGHTSVDWDIAWGGLVPNCTDNAYCYSILNATNPDPMKYRAVFMLVETETGVYEVSYGHFSTILAKVGQTYKAGEIIGYVGNTGDVYAGGRYVTKEEKLAGSHAGAHLHGPQIRPVQRVTKRSKGKQYLSDANGLLKKDGFYFEVIDYGNGYNGCVDVAPFWNGHQALDRDKIVALQEKQLTLLQQLLALYQKLIGKK